VTNETAEAAMRRACDLIMAGDFFNAMADLTPEAMAEAMNLGMGMQGLPLPESYVLSEPEQTGDDTRYEVTFKAGEREMIAFAAWRQIDGAWKIASIGIVSTT
jgi:hypothetical protein